MTKRLSESFTWYDSPNGVEHVLFLPMEGAVRKERRFLLVIGFVVRLNEAEKIENF